MDLPWLPPTFHPEKICVAAGVHADAIMTALADLQHGVVTAPQLLRLGVTRRQIDSRRDSGHLVRVSAGVYLVARARLTPAGRRMAGTLAAGRSAALADLSAVAQLGVAVTEPLRVNVIVPPGRQVLRRGVKARSGVVHDHEHDVVDGIPCLTMGRALLDVAAHRDRSVAREVWREAAFRRRLVMSDIRRVLDEHAGEAGAPILLGLYEDRLAAIGASANRFEAAMRSIVAEAGMPEPRCNVPLELDGVTLRPDLYIAERRLAFEMDGRDGHEDPERQAEDERRDERYRRAGIVVGRYGWWAVHYERQRVLADVVRFEKAWQRCGGLWSDAEPAPRLVYARRAA